MVHDARCTAVIDAETLVFADFQIRMRCRALTPPGGTATRRSEATEQLVRNEVEEEVGAYCPAAEELGVDRVGASCD